MAEAMLKYFDPKIINRISRLELRARHIVEGFLTGMHKSPYHGFSIEFAAHREYTPGDDLRHLDWKVYGRSDRLYIKEYELETNLRSHILLDTSESMEYRSEDLSKLELACFIAASLAYLIISQQDAVSLVCFDKEIRRQVPPGSGQGHMKPLLTQLASSFPERKTDIASVFHAMAERIQYRGMIIIISDLFDNPDNIMSGLQHFRFKRHDVIVFHVMDTDEVTFPFRRLTRFIGLEEYPEILADPIPIRAAYLEAVNEFCAQVRRGCMKQMIDYELITTDKQIDVALSKYLATRLGTKLKGTRR
jgi:uncharacterized protein (DUF58 family)